MNSFYLSLYIILGAVSALAVMWIFYVFVMALKRAQNAGTLSPIAKVIGLTIGAPALLLDVAINFTIGTVVFLDIPKEWTLSERMCRYYSPENTDWRSELSGILAKAFLDPFDPDGQHID